MEEVSGRALIAVKGKRYLWAIYFFLYIIFFLSQPFDLLWSTHESYKNRDFTLIKSQEGSVQRRIALTGLSIFVIGYSLRRKKRNLCINGILGGTITFFFIWTVISISWSGNSLITIRKVLVLLIIGLGAITVSQYLSLLQIMSFIVFSGTLTLILGVLSEIYQGIFSPFKEGYRFGGITHPTFQGWSLGLLCIASLFFSKIYQPKRIVYILIGLVSFIFLLLTKARGPTWGIIVTLIVYLFIAVPKRRKHLIVYIIILCALLYIAYVSLIDDYNFSSLANIIALGREDSNISTLTGRVGVWQVCILYIGHRPLHGYGYETFWTPEHLATVKIDPRGWAFPDSHNGYLSILLGLGVIGFITYIIIHSLGIIKYLSIYKLTGKSEYLFASLSIIFLLMNIFVVAGQLEPYINSFIHLAVVTKLGFSRLLEN